MKKLIFFIILYINYALAINCVPSSVEEIRHGTFLGEGYYGTVYKLNLGAEENPAYFVFKIFKKTDTYGNPERSVRLWNEFYSNSYGKKFIDFANAEIITTRFGTKVLKTPFIEGNHHNSFVFRLTRGFGKYRRLTQEFKGLGREMHDFNNSNIVIHRYNGQKFALPIDFDNVFSIKSEDTLSEASENWHKDKADALANAPMGMM